MSFASTDDFEIPSDSEMQFSQPGDDNPARSEREEPDWDSEWDVDVEVEPEPDGAEPEPEEARPRPDPDWVPRPDADWPEPLYNADTSERAASGPDAEQDPNPASEPSEADESESVDDGGATKPSDNGKMKKGMSRATLPRMIKPKFEEYRNFFPQKNVTDDELCDLLYESDKHKGDGRLRSIKEIKKLNQEGGTISGSVKLDAYVVADLENKNQPDLGTNRADGDGPVLCNARSITGGPKYTIRKHLAKRKFEKASAEETAADASMATLDAVDVSTLTPNKLIDHEVLLAEAKERKYKAKIPKAEAEMEFLSAGEDLAVRSSGLPNANRSHHALVYEEMVRPYNEAVRSLRIPRTDTDAFKMCVQHSFKKTRFSLTQEEQGMLKKLEAEDHDDKEELSNELREAYAKIHSIHNIFLQRNPMEPEYKVFAHEAIANSTLNVPEPIPFGPAPMPEDYESPLNQPEEEPAEPAEPEAPAQAPAAQPELIEVSEDEDEEEPQDNDAMNIASSTARAKESMAKSAMMLQSLKRSRDLVEWMMCDEDLEEGEIRECEM